MNDGVRAEFDLEWRGYDRGQVDRSFAQLESKLVDALAERELLSDLPAQLAAANLEIESVHREMDRLRLAGPPGDARPVSVKLEAILAMAEDEAARLRQEASDTLASARVEADRIIGEANARAAAARRDFDLAMQHRRKKETQGLVAAAQAEADGIVAAARAEAEKIRSGQRAAGVDAKPAASEPAVPERTGFGLKSVLQAWARSSG